MTARPWSLDVYDTLPTTADLIAARAAEGAPDGTAILARRQTQARGSRGRTWCSPAGNLALSVLLRPNEPASRAGEWPLLVAVAVADALLPLLPDPALLSLKWPNDVLLRGRKLAGILIEAEVAPSGVLSTLLVGIGLNLRAAPDLPDRPAAALAEIVAPPNPEAMAVPILDAIGTRRAARAALGFAAIRDAWLARAHPVGTALTVEAGDERIAGAFAGLTESGLLQLRKNGGIRVLSAGDVLLGPAPRKPG